VPDDDLRRAFADTGAWAERHTELPGPDRARRTARRRSTATVAGAVLTLLAVVGGVVGVSRLDGPPATAPAAPSLAPSSLTEPPRPVPTAIPDDLPLEPAPSDDGEVATRDVEELLVDVCPGEGIPGVDAAVDRRYRLTTGPEFATSTGLLVFADADGAVAFLGGLRAAAQRCAEGVPRPEGGTRSIRREPLPGAWGEGVTLLLLDVPTPGGDYQPVVGTYLLVVRTGSAVGLRLSAGEYLSGTAPAAPSPDVVALERRPLDALAPRLCLWTVASC
jgi:hypothetical protein